MKNAQAAFFPRHDLTHFAVETVLGYQHAFFGMIADGWDISDFGPPWAKGRLPDDMDPAELIVGFLDAERASGTRWTGEDFSDLARIYYRDHNLHLPPPTRTDDELARIRARRAELFAEWEAVTPGGTLELAFAVGTSEDSTPQRAGSRTAGRSR